MSTSDTTGCSGMWKLKEHNERRLGRLSLSLVLGLGHFYVKENGSQMSSLGFVCTLLWTDTEWKR